MNFLRKNWKSNAMIHPAHLLTFMEPYVENDHVFMKNLNFTICFALNKCAPKDHKNHFY